MQAEDSPRAVPSERSGLKPTTAFFILLSAAALVAATVYLTRPAPTPTPTGTDTAKTAPNFALTNEEAIARFEELHETELDAYRHADASLVEEVFTPDSPIVASVRKEIGYLVEDGVSADPRYTTLKIDVLSNTPTEVKLKQVAHVESHFYDGRGREITSDMARQRQTIVWTLRLVASKWLIHDARVTKSR